jgi:hypothetical protein
MLAAAAKALFSTGDVVSIAPENDADQGQTISASLKQELLNYRLSRIARRNGIPWFQTAMGARFNSALTGICASKQQWLYKEKTDEETGEIEVVLDRPDILLFPSENVLFDPNCDWTAPAQSASYVILNYPMNLGDARELIRSNVGNGMNIPWRDVSDAELARLSPRQARRKPREHAQPVTAAKTPSPRQLATSPHAGSPRRLCASMVRSSCGGRSTTTS